ncbi:transposable element Tc1 transposase [Trichonephila clavipes]|nr:transposable element Tc1 transposase [Trichonephila clavipes]
MAVNDRAASSRQLAASWSTATGVLMSTWSIRRRLQHRGGRGSRVQGDCHQDVFSNESRFNLWDHDGRIRVRRYAGERCLPECVIEPHSGRTPRFIFWGDISYHGRSNLLRIESNPNSNRDLELEVNEDDIEKHIMGHEDELTIEKLQEILNEELQETQRNVSPSEQEED